MNPTLGQLESKIDYADRRALAPYNDGRMLRKYTLRSEEYIYEKVKQLTVEQVSQNEQLSAEQVERIFQRVARLKKKTGEPLNV